MLKHQRSATQFPFKKLNSVEPIAVSKIRKKCFSGDAKYGNEHFWVFLQSR